MNVQRLYEDDEVVFEKFENGKYRVTFFREDNHWAGDITFSKKKGVIWDDVKEDRSWWKDLIMRKLKKRLSRR